jgi:DNA-binding NarL/FixJ family response regulator
MQKASANTTSIGIVDDHQLFVRSLCLLVNSFNAFETTIDALNGDQLLTKLKDMPELPEILLIDVNMPSRDGPSTATVIAEKYPLIKMIALSMNDDDISIISMIKAGCCAYLLKGVHPTELERALEEVHQFGYYNGDSFNVNHRRLSQRSASQHELHLTEREIKFLQLSCSELTYKEIASQLFVSERTVDGYRESVFEKMKVHSRVGMVLEAIKLKIIRLP